MHMQFATRPTCMNKVWLTDARRCCSNSNLLLLVYPSIFGLSGNVTVNYNDDEILAFCECERSQLSEIYIVMPKVTKK